MLRLSSIFSFDTLTAVPRVTPSLILTLAVCLAFRLALVAASNHLDNIPSPAIHQRYIQLERALVRSAVTKPKIVLMGNSNIRYGLLEDQIAVAAGLEPSQVVNLGIEAGRAWDARVCLDRNPAFFDEVELVIFNVALNQIHMSAVTKRLSHFYRFSSLREKLTTDRFEDRVRLALDWLWPFHSERRDLITWCLGIRGQSDCDGRFCLRPAWEPDHMAALLARRKIVCRPNPDFPDRFLGTDGLQAAYRPPAISRSHQRILEQFISCWKHRGVRLLLIGTPTSTAWHEAHQHHALARAQQAQFEAMIDSMTTERTAYLHWRAGTEIGLDDRVDFLDDGHLTPCGAMKLTGLVVDALMARGWLPLEENRSNDLQVVAVR